MKTDCLIEEWDETHPRWHEFVACLEMAAPDQAPFKADLVDTIAPASRTQNMGDSL